MFPKAKVILAKSPRKFVVSEESTAEIFDAGHAQTTLW